MEGELARAFNPTGLRQMPKCLSSTTVLTLTLVIAACYVLQCGRPTRPTETKSTKLKQRNDSDNRYLILETTGTW